MKVILEYHTHPLRYGVYARTDKEVVGWPFSWPNLRPGQIVELEIKKTK